MIFSRVLFVVFLFICSFKSFSQDCGFNENTFRSGGTFSGDCILDVGGSITVTGNIIITSGRITINDSGGGGNGDMEIVAGGSITIRPGATLDFDDGALVIDGGSLTVDAGGTLELLENDEDTDLTVDGGTLTVNGALFLRDDLIIENGSTVTFGPMSTADLRDDIIITGGSDVTIEAGADIVVDEELDLDDSSLTIAGSIRSNASDDLNISDGAVLTINDPASVLFNDLEVGGGDGSTINVNGGTLTLEGEIDFNDRTNGTEIIVNGGAVVVESDLELGNTTDGTITVNPGGSFSTPSIDNDGQDQFTDPSDLPDNIILAGGDFSVGTSSLPVELISFNASLIEEGSAVHLKWITATEINNQGFSVEKSHDAITWNELTFIKGNGTTSDINEYEFFDLDVKQSAYYRFRQLDDDGKYEISPLRFVSLVIASNNPINVYPNPTSDKISLSSLHGDSYSIQVMDLSGRVKLSMEAADQVKAESAINEMLSNEASGVYLLRFSNPGHTEVIRLIKD